MRNERCPDCGAAKHEASHNGTVITYMCGARECQNDDTGEWRHEDSVECLRWQCVRLKVERLALARLASDKPEFTNPLRVAAAQRLRDHILNAVKKAG